LYSSRSIILKYITIIFFILYSGVGLTQDLIGTSKQILGNYIVGAIKSSTPDFIKYFDAEYKFSADNPDNISLTALSAISESSTSSLFNQTTIVRHDDNTTVNIGLGYRSLLNNDKAILGLNAFYDREINVTHQRYGIGLEFLTSIFDLRSNYYEAFSDTKLVENNFDLRPGAIIKQFDLKQLPQKRGGRFYKDTAAYGHFGRPDLNLPWENVREKAQEISKFSPNQN